MHQEIITKGRMNHLGQATAEMLLTVGLVGMLILAAASLFQLFNADLKANKAARLAAWHGTLYQGMSEEQLAEKIRNNVGRTVLDRASTQTELLGRSSGERAAIVGESSDIEFTFGDEDPTYVYPTNRSTTIATRAGLNDNRIGTVSVSLPLNDLLVTKIASDTGRRGFCPPSTGHDSCSSELTDVSAGYDPVAGVNRANLRAQAALLGNSFIPENEEAFKNAIAGISADGTPMTVFEALRAPLSWLGFDEVDASTGPNGLSTVADEQSRILPQELGVFP